MNTINSVRPYMNLKNNSQVPTTHAQSPAFKANLNKPIVKGVANPIKKNKTGVMCAITLALAPAVAFMNNLLEKLGFKEKELTSEKKENVKQNLDSNKLLKEESMGIIISEAEKSLRTAGNLKSEQVTSLVKSMQANYQLALDSLYSFVMTGSGEEDFLSYMKMQNVIKKAHESNKLSDEPAVKQALLDAELPDVLSNNDLVITTQMLMFSLILNSEDKSMTSEDISKRVLENAKVLIPRVCKDTGWLNEADFDNAIEASVDDASFDIKKIKQTVEELAKEGYKRVSTTKCLGSLSQSYMTFQKEDGTRRDYPICSLMRPPEIRIYREIDVNGNVVFNSTELS